MGKGRRRAEWGVMIWCKWKITGQVWIMEHQSRNRKEGWWKRLLGWGKRGEWLWGPKGERMMLNRMDPEWETGYWSRKIKIGQGETRCRMKSSFPTHTLTWQERTSLTLDFVAPAFCQISGIWPWCWRTNQCMGLEVRTRESRWDLEIVGSLRSFL